MTKNCFSMRYFFELLHFWSMSEYVHNANYGNQKLINKSQELTWMLWGCSANRIRGAGTGAAMTRAHASPCDHKLLCPSGNRLSALTKGKSIPTCQPKPGNTSIAHPVNCRTGNGATFCVVLTIIDLYVQSTNYTLLRSVLISWTLALLSNYECVAWCAVDCTVPFIWIVAER
jgi:hypothetical protein